MKTLIEREWRRLWEYTRTGSNASQAARVVYGGTRVKGHKKMVKLRPLLDRMYKMWGQFLVRKPNGQLSIGKRTDQIEREVDAHL